MIDPNELSDLREMFFPEMQEFIASFGLEEYKAKIIWQWIYKKRVINLREITSLSARDKEALSTGAYISSAQVIEKKASPDGTEKYLLRLKDGCDIECVYMPGKVHNTACVSTQAGCAQKCTFCATGAGGFRRNLRPFEIVEQLLAMQRDGKIMEYVVLMGMGEPLSNFDNVVESIKMINSPEVLGIGGRRITLSTAGIVDRIKKLADLELGINLAVSLNASNNDLRSRLMPINRKYPLKQLIDAAEYFQKKSGRRVTFEYVLLDHVNDSDKDADDLGKLVRDLICHVNLINYNNSPQSGAGFLPSRRVKEFRERLLAKQISVSIRKSIGTEISAACGQLAGKKF